MANTDLQLNESVNGYVRVPYSHFKTMRCRSQILIMSTIFSFSDSNERCNMTYRSFEEKLRLSHGTVARRIKDLKEENKIDQDKSRRAGASYSCTKRTKERGFVKIDFYLFATKFNVRDEAEPRYLTHAEINVLSLIKTHCSNKKGDRRFKGSVRGIARTLNLSDKIVQKSISTLLKAELIFRPSADRGINGHKRSTFTVNEKLLRRSEKNYKKETASKQTEQQNRQDGVPTEWQNRIQKADERTEHERYYSTLRNKALSRIEWFKNQLDQDDKYKRLNTALRTIEPRIVRADVLHLPELERLKMEERRLRAERAKRMTELNISEADLIPKWHCPKCEDTGFMRDGRICDCYPKGRRTR